MRYPRWWVRFWNGVGRALEPDPEPLPEPYPPSAEPDAEFDHVREVSALLQKTIDHQAEYIGELHKEIRGRDAEIQELRQWKVGYGHVTRSLSDALERNAILRDKIARMRYEAAPLAGCMVLPTETVDD